MILAAYYRGLASLETEFIRGSMASIGKYWLGTWLQKRKQRYLLKLYFVFLGIGYETAKLMIPSDIDIACHNGPESCTLSGPSESIQKFVESLQAKGIFAREVKVSNIAYHSRYISVAGPKLLAYMRKVRYLRNIYITFSTMLPIGLIKNNIKKKLSFYTLLEPAISCGQNKQLFNRSMEVSFPVYPSLILRWRKPSLAFFNRW